jgi:hypothetical protein
METGPEFIVLVMRRTIEGWKIRGEGPLKCFDQHQVVGMCSYTPEMATVEVAHQQTNRDINRRMERAVDKWETLEYSPSSV